MAIEIRMPELGAEVTEADLLEWLVAVGDRVEAGDLIAEIETDKATVEFESPASGVVLELCVAAGTRGITVGELLARLEGEGEDERDADAASEPWYLLINVITSRNHVRHIVVDFDRR